MKIKYVGMFSEVEIAATGQTVESGETVEVEDAVAKELIKQGDNWVKVADRKKKES